ncbi:unnamed protein product, partial [Allacma fusca]
MAKFVILLVGTLAIA